jgi:actin-related protein
LVTYRQFEGLIVRRYLSVGYDELHICSPLIKGSNLELALTRYEVASKKESLIVKFILRNKQPALPSYDFLLASYTSEEEIDEKYLCSQKLFDHDALIIISRLLKD